MRKFTDPVFYKTRQFCKKRWQMTGREALQKKQDSLCNVQNTTSYENMFSLWTSWITPCEWPNTTKDVWNKTHYQLRQKAPLLSFISIRLLKMCFKKLSEKSLTEREDLRECPLSSRTEKDAVLARQPSSLHTPSHFSVWLVFQIGNYK